MNRVGAPVFVTIMLTNSSGVEQNVKNMSARIDASADSRFSPGDECGLAVMGELTLGPGETFSQTCRFPVSREANSETEPRAASQADSGWHSGYVIGALSSADVRLVIDVDVEKVGSRLFYPVVVVKAREFSIFVGGVAGAMLLALFVFAERLIRSPMAREEWLRTLFVTIVLGVRGGLLAVIALLLGKTTQGVGSPVSLTVVDFGGGVLVGLFSYPLATWISSRLELPGSGKPVPGKDSAQDNQAGVDTHDPEPRVHEAGAR
jgi:hypothetical protein